MTSTVCFELHATDTSWGDEVALVGNLPALSEWNTAADPPPTLKPSPFPQWTVSITFPQNTAIEYKYVIMRHGLLTHWEPGANRHLKTPSAGHHLHINDGSFGNPSSSLTCPPIASPPVPSRLASPPPPPRPKTPPRPHLPTRPPSPPAPAMHLSLPPTLALSFPTKSTPFLHTPDKTVSEPVPSFEDMCAVIQKTRRQVDVIRAQLAALPLCDHYRRRHRPQAAPDTSTLHYSSTEDESIVRRSNLTKNDARSIELAQASVNAALADVALMRTRLSLLRASSSKRPPPFSPTLSKSVSTRQERRYKFPIQIWPAVFLALVIAVLCTLKMLPPSANNHFPSAIDRDLVCWNCP